MAAACTLLAVIAITFAQAGCASLSEVAPPIDEPSPAGGEVEEEHLLQYVHHGALKGADYATVEGRGVADNVKNCIETMETLSLGVGQLTESSFYQLMDRVTDARRLLSDCDKSNDLDFVRCFGAKGLPIRDNATLSLLALREALQLGYANIAAYFDDGIDCISRNLQSVIPH